jgi:hypothetical protein
MEWVDKNTHENEAFRRFHAKAGEVPGAADRGPVEGARPLRVKKFPESSGQLAQRTSGRWGPYRNASPHRPGTAPAHGLRAGNDVSPL